LNNKIQYRHLFYIGCLTLLVSACNYLPSSKVDAESPAAAGTGTDEEISTTISPEKEKPTIAAKSPDHRQKQQQILEMGSGKFIATPKQHIAQTSVTADGDITLNFQDTDLREFVKVILGDVLGSSYVIDPKVAGKVTIDTARPINKEELLPLLEDILGMNAAALVQTDDIYRILPKNQAVRGNLAPDIVEKELAGGYAVRIIPLRFIAAPEMQKILEPFVSDTNDIRIDKRRNLVIASGTAQELALIQETIDIFDVDWLRGMSVGLYPLDYVDPKTMKTELDSIMGAVQGDTNKELLDGLVRTVSIERLNSILLIGSTPTALREVEIWLHRLDRPGEHVGQRLYVYDVQNAKATEIGDILSNIFGTSSTASSSAQAPELAPGLTPVEISSKEGEVAKPAVDSTGKSTSARSSSESGIALPSSDAIQIIADDVRNAIVVLATPQDYLMIEEAIRKLDVVPLQVLIEASILEVSLRDDLSYGVEWFFKNSIENREGRGTLDLGDTGLAALSPGFSFTIVDSADQVRIALNALQNESAVNVLSSPSLMVLDNQTAMINVGDEIPVPTRQSVSNIDPNSPTVNEIQFRQTGVTLTVTPRVNSGGLVTMEIKQEVSSAVSTTSSNIDAPTIQQRQIESVVAINSGETIVLGGLIQNTQTANEGGIPLLHKIPLLGKLFGQTSNENRRTELLVLITPRVVRNRNEARNITNEFRRKLRGITPPDIKLRPADKEAAS
jgi:general secretion pathway protein D